MKNIITILILLLCFSCNTNDNADAYGNFESTETTVSSKQVGEIVFAENCKGKTINKSDILFIIDTVNLDLQKEKLIAQQKLTQAKINEINAEITIIRTEKETVLREYKRLENLLKDGAVTKQNFDTIKDKIKIIEAKIKALNTKKVSINKNINVIQKSIDIVNKQLKDCFVKSPIKGTIIEQYVEIGELVSPGKPLFKVANIKQMKLKAYISGNRISSLKIGQKVQVKIDKNNKDFYTYEGKIIYISNKAEFTPKIIQTKEERVNLVYAFEVLVKNDGKIKIGMPGEVRFK